MVLTSAKARQFEVSISVEGQSGVMIECDEVEIEQVVINMINNSIDSVVDLDERWIKIYIFTDNKNVVLRFT